MKTCDCGRLTKNEDTICDVCHKAAATSEPKPPEYCIEPRCLKKKWKDDRCMKHWKDDKGVVRRKPGPKPGRNSIIRRNMIMRKGPME